MKLMIKILMNLESISGLFLFTQSQYLLCWLKKQDKESDYFDIDWEKNFLKNICTFEYKHM